MGKEKPSAEATINSIRRKTRRKYNAEEKIRIVLEGLRGEDSIAELCRREGISQSLYYSWSEAGKMRLTGDKMAILIDRLIKWPLSFAVSTHHPELRISANFKQSLMPRY